MEGAQQPEPSLFNLQNCEYSCSTVYIGETAVNIPISRSGRKVYTTCSPKHFELMKSRGADFVYDYVCADYTLKPKSHLAFLIKLHHVN